MHAVGLAGSSTGTTMNTDIAALGLMTPATVHAGLAQQSTTQRQQVLLAVYEQHPQRFVAGIPRPPQVPEAVWINPPIVVEATNPG